MPTTLPPVLSWLNGNSSGNSSVAAITRESIIVGKPSKLTGNTPLKPCLDGVNCPVVLWLSAGATTLSCWKKVSKGRLS